MSYNVFLGSLVLLSRITGETQVAKSCLSLDSSGAWSSEVFKQSYKFIAKSQRCRVSCFYKLGCMGVMPSEMPPSTGHPNELWCHQVVLIVQMAVCTCVLPEQVVFLFCFVVFFFFESTWKFQLILLGKKSKRLLAESITKGDIFICLSLNLCSLTRKKISFTNNDLNISC